MYTLIDDEHRVEREEKHEIAHIHTRIAEDANPAIEKVRRASILLGEMSVLNFKSKLNEIYHVVDELISHADGLEKFMRGTHTGSTMKLTKESLEAIKRSIEEDIRHHVWDKSPAEKQEWINHKRDEIKRSVDGQLQFFERSRRVLQDTIAFESRELAQQRHLERQV